MCTQGAALQSTGGPVPTGVQFLIVARPFKVSLPFRTSSDKDALRFWPSLIQPEEAHVLFVVRRIASFQKGEAQWDAGVCQGLVPQQLRVRRFKAQRDLVESQTHVSFSTSSRRLRSQAPLLQTWHAVATSASLWTEVLSTRVNSKSGCSSSEFVLEVASDSVCDHVQGCMCNLRYTHFSITMLRQEPFHWATSDGESPRAAFQSMSVNTVFCQSPIGHGHDTWVCFGSRLGFVGLHTHRSKVLFAQKSSALRQSESNTFGDRGDFKLQGFAELDCTERFLRPKNTRHKSQCERAFLASQPQCRSLHWPPSVGPCGSCSVEQLTSQTWNCTVSNQLSND